MNPDKYILKIDNPCRQEWASMTTTDIGKFCSHCNKSVVDFTQMSDNEMLKTIEQNRGKLCGRLSKNQLNRQIEFVQPTGNSGFYKILAALLFFGTSQNLWASQNNQINKDFATLVENDSTNTKSIKTKSGKIIEPNNNIIQGEVFDFDTRELLPFVNIQIKGSHTGTTTNIDGQYQLLIPEGLLTEKIYLIVSYVGYENLEIEIKKTDLPMTKNIILVYPPNVLMGDVVAVKKKKWWQIRK